MKFGCRCEERWCKFYKGVRALDNGDLVHYCVGFHNGIPEEILNGENDHLTLMQGQTRAHYNGEQVIYALPNKDIVAPYRESYMHKRNMWGRDNLCSTLRDLYLKTEDEELKFWLRIAVTMTKNMYHSLKEYQQMLVEMGVPVEKDTRQHWQERPRSLLVPLPDKKV
jgi:hypothetical protein